MKLIRYEQPEQSAPLSRLDNWFSAPFMGRDWPNLFGNENHLMAWNQILPGHGMSADLFEDSDAYYARFEVPGVKKGDLRVELDNAVLTVSYERRRKDNDNGETTGRFARSLSIPDGILPDKVTAELEDGILAITLPKAESKKPVAIKVK